MKLVDADGQAAKALLLAYRQLEVFQENVATLDLLRQRNVPLAILSNGDEEMLHAVVDHARLGPYFEHILSCDQVAALQDAPEAYQLACDCFQMSRQRDAVRLVELLGRLRCGVVRLEPSGSIATQNRSKY